VGLPKKKPLITQGLKLAERRDSNEVFNDYRNKDFEFYFFQIARKVPRQAKLQA
jgi:hypothetical protein